MYFNLSEEIRNDSLGGIVRENQFFEKLYLVLAICGGVKNLTRGYLEGTGKYEELSTIINRDHSTVFTSALDGEATPFGVPTVELPGNGSTFADYQSMQVSFYV